MKVFLLAAYFVHNDRLPPRDLEEMQIVFEISSNFVIAVKFLYG